MNHAPDSDWLSRFAELADLDAESRRLLESRAKIVEIGAGHTVFAPGKMPEAFLLLLDGAVRVQQVGESGREIVLYRVSGGESCIMTTACLLSDESYQAEGVTETDVRAVALARNDFDDLMARSAGFRRFVFTKNQHVSGSHFSVHSDFLSNCCIRIVNFDTNSSRFQSGFYFCSIFNLLF